MSATTELAPTARRSDDIRVISSVSAAHFVSHYFYLVLPPLFAFVRADYGVSYTELGLALTVFNGVSAVLQTPAGFLVDRFNARLVLVAGLLIQVVAFAAIGLVNSFWVLVAMYGLIGLGNTVYHPADYSILSRQVAAERLTYSYSVHTFSGLLGGAAAPAVTLFLHSLFGWRGAFLGAAMLGLAVAAFLLLQRDPTADAAPAKVQSDATPDTSWRLLLTTPILINFVFFMMLSFSSVGLTNFSVVALGALYDTPPVIANAGLTGSLLLGAIGVLVGGWIAGNTTRHGLTAALLLAITASATLLIGNVDLGALLLIVVMSLSGFCTGMIMPSRDMLVRAVTPPGAFGKVFGFVTNGFNIAGIFAPLMFGAMMDHGSPRLVFFAIAAGGLAGIITLASAPKRRAA
jgi:MFS family permease